MQAFIPHGHIAPVLIVSSRISSTDNLYVCVCVCVCVCVAEWRHIAKDRTEWRGTVAALVEDLNEKSEMQEKQRKDEQKKRSWLALLHSQERQRAS